MTIYLVIDKSTALHDNWPLIKVLLYVTKCMVTDKSTALRANIPGHWLKYSLRDNIPGYLQYCVMWQYTWWLLINVQLYLTIYLITVLSTTLLGNIPGYWLKYCFTWQFTWFWIYTFSKSAALDSIAFTWCRDENSQQFSIRKICTLQPK